MSDDLKAANSKLKAILTSVSEVARGSVDLSQEIAALSSSVVFTTMCALLSMAGLFASCFWLPGVNPVSLLGPALAFVFMLGLAAGISACGGLLLFRWLLSVRGISDPKAVIARAKPYMELTKDKKLAPAIMLKLEELIELELSGGDLRASTKVADPVIRTIDSGRDNEGVSASGTTMQQSPST